MPAKNRQEEVSHLIHDRHYDPKRAVAASYSMERRGAFRKKKRKSKRKHSR